MPTNVYTGTVTVSASDATTDITITSVDTAKTLIMISGYMSSAGLQNGPRDYPAYELTSATNIRLHHGDNAYACYVRWWAIEKDTFTVQRGSFANTVGSSGLNVTLSSVNTAKAFPIICLTQNDGFFEDGMPCTAKITTSTNLEIKGLYNLSTGVNAKRFYQVVEDSACSVQRLDTTSGFSTTVDTAISTVDTAKTMLLGNVRVHWFSSKFASGQLSLSSSTNLRAKWNADPTTAPVVEYSTHVVEFTDATAVQRFERSVGLNSSTDNFTITSVDTSRAFACGSNVSQWQSCATSVSGNNAPKFDQFRIDLVSSTSVETTRVYLADNTAPLHHVQVIEFPAAASGNLAGTAAGIATTTGAIYGIGALAGSAAGSSTSTATLGGGQSSGSAAGSSTATASITGTSTVTGNAGGVATSIGAIAGRGGVSGLSAGTSTATGAAYGIGALAGSASGSSTTTGTVYDGSSSALTGSASGASTATGTAYGRGALTGSASGASTATGGAHGIGALTGGASGSSTTTGAIGAREGQIYGTANGVSTATGGAYGRGQLSGAVAGASTATATMAGTGAQRTPGLIEFAVRTNARAHEAKTNASAIGFFNSVPAFYRPVVHVIGSAAGSSAATATIVGLGPFAPRTPALWFSSSDVNATAPVDGAGIAEWKNLGSYASADAVQAVEIKRPVFVAVDPILGKPAVRTGFGKWIMTGTTADIPQPDKIAFVFRVESLTAAQTILDGANVTPRRQFAILFAGNPNMLISAGTPSSYSGMLITTGVWHTVIVNVNPAGSYVRLNGSQSANLPLNAQYLDGLSIGGSRTGTTTLDGAFAEVLVYGPTDQPSDAEIEDFFDAKYGSGWPKL